MTNQGDPPPSPGAYAGPTKVAIARTVAAVIISLSLIGVGLASYLIPALRVCRDEATANGRVVQVCGPLGAGDALLVGLVVLAILLLLPGIAEFAIPGLVSVKRDVRELRAAVSRIAILQEGNFTNQIFLGERDFQRAAQGLTYKVPAFEGNAASQDVVALERLPADPDRSISDERAVLEAQLLRAWSQLEPYVRAAGPEISTLDGAAELGVTRSTAIRLMPRLYDWRGYFKDEIELVRTTRNTVAHHPDRLSDEQLKSALAIAERLHDVLRRDVLQGPR